MNLADIAGNLIHEKLTLNALARADLELPLGGHNLSVGSGDLDTSEQASLVVSLDDISAVNLASTNTTVVWALGAWETICWPAIGSIGHVEKGVFLLKTEPWLMSLMGFHELGSLVAVVEFVWRSIGVPAFSNDQNIGALAEWVGEDSNGAEVDIGVVAWSLTGRAAVEVPLWEVIESEFTALWNTGEGLQRNNQSDKIRAIVRLRKERCKSCG